MEVRFQRLLIILLSLILLAGSILLILFNSKKNLVFFYTPTELIRSDSETEDIVRVGGYVEKGSIINKGNNSYSFNITDNINTITIEYNGFLPDLFKEEQGTVIEGKLIERSKVKAFKVFAKHDENYMPASIQKQLKQTDYWNKKY